MIPLVKHTFHNEKVTKKRLIGFIKKAKKLSFGDECLKFERSFAHWQGRKESIFFNSGSSANLALIQALLNLGRLKRGDRIAFSDLTWSTNLMPLIQLGLKAVPMDINRTTLNSGSKDVLHVIKRHQVKAVFLTHILGFCDDVDKIKKICRENNVILIEDNCEALGSVYKKKQLGNFGLASTVSFFVGHHLSTLEGGMVCTDDRELARELRMARAHGWDRHLNRVEQKSLRRRHQIDKFHSLYTFYDLGYNFRPTEINGFLGNIQMPYADEIVADRQRIFKRLANAVYHRSDLYSPVDFDHLDTISALAFPLICKSLAIKNKLIEKCENKIEIRPIVGGSMSNQPFFKKYYPHNQIKCQHSVFVHRQGLYFPIYPQMTERDIKFMIKIMTGV